MAILKFYSKLINNNLLYYVFTPIFSAGHHHHNFRNPSRLLPKTVFEIQFDIHYYETSNDLLDMDKTQSQRNCMNIVRNYILNGYSCTCKLLVCHICKQI